MEKCVATIVIEPRSLVREALVSLMASHSYHVVVVSPRRPTSTILCLSQIHPGSSSLVHCRPLWLLLPRAAFASCDQERKSFYSSSMRHRPTFKSCWLRR